MFTSQEKSVAKVFGIGFHKTGTKSLGKALEILGYRVCGSFSIHNPNLEEQVHQIADTLVAKYDAFQDNPWPVLYQELDRKYPGSKFILIIRPVDSWINSIVSHFGSRNTHMREWIYGVGHPKGNEKIYIERYERHNAEVIEYFKDRPNDLLVLQLNQDNLWEKICPFLEKEIPHVEFPHVNKKQNKKLARAVKNIKKNLQSFSDISQ
ncbi:sulfotransferase family protein [Pleurocapsa sp. PCC 7319]|uniref:sulfotransferase family protein n=1 Tax=Pleurocapsa sp. PCC 7319 TaxID=118161 RepID=UPI00034C5FE1|nr:sulfotransferase family protein [Pleurocapsa sp. PCC 7319]